jgi:hypothetical protein
MYPRNAASPEKVAVGAVITIADGSVVTSGASVSVLGQGGSTGAGGGTIGYENGVVTYIPTQAETNYTSFIVTAYKTGCIPAGVTVVTSASVTPGYAGVDWSKVTAPTTTVGLSGTTVKTATDIATQIGTNGGGLTAVPAYGDFSATQKTTLNTATGIIDSGTASAIAAGTITLATGHSFGTNTMAGATVMAYGSTQGYWQSNTVLSNSNASASVLTMTDNWVVTPSGTVTYQVLGSTPVSAAHPPGVALKVINTTTLTGDGSATPWGPA